MPLHQSTWLAQSQLFCPCIYRSAFFSLQSQYHHTKAELARGGRRGMCKKPSVSPFLLQTSKPKVDCCVTFLGKMWTNICLPEADYPQQTKEVVLPTSTLVNEFIGVACRNLSGSWASLPQKKKTLSSLKLPPWSSLLNFQATALYMGLGRGLLGPMSLHHP